MTDAVETMAWANTPPWHSLGTKVSNNLSPEQMCEAAGINWTVSKRPVFYKNAAGEYLPAEREFILARDSDDQFLSAVGTHWKPNQNIDAFGVFKKFVTAGKMKMETAGSLMNGKYVWGLAKLEANFAVGKSDEVKGYMLMSNPHVHGKSIIYKTTAVRVVCWNTLTMALGANLRGAAFGAKEDEGTFRVPHSQKFNSEAAEIAIGLATGLMDELKDASNLLAKKKAKPDKVEEYFGRLLNFDPAKAAHKKKDGVEIEAIKEPDMLKQFRAMLETGPGADLNTAKGTWWGATQAVTHTIDHRIGNSRDTALRAAWFGRKAGLKVDAFKLALEYAK